MTSKIVVVFALAFIQNGEVEIQKTGLSWADCSREAVVKQDELSVSDLERGTDWKCYKQLAQVGDDD